MRTFLLSAAFLLVSIGSTIGQTLKQIVAFDLPGPAGKRFDYLTIDYEDHYLLSAHLAAGILYVIDLRTNKLVKAVPGFPASRAWSTCQASRKCTRRIPATTRSAWLI